MAKGNVFSHVQDPGPTPHMFKHPTEMASCSVIMLIQQNKYQGVKNHIGWHHWLWNGVSPCSVTILKWNSWSLFLTAATKLGQGNIFTPVCDSVNQWGGGQGGGSLVLGGGVFSKFLGGLQFFWGGVVWSPIFKGVSNFLGWGSPIFQGGLQFFRGSQFFGGSPIFLGRG